MGDAGGKEMTSDEQRQRLHDRATRGQTLSQDEQAQLDAWYAAQDRAEAAALDLDVTEVTASLQAQIDTVLTQLAATTGRIQELGKENETLRQEIALVRHQLAERAVLQPA